MTDPGASKPFREFSIGVIVASTLFGVAGGLLPFGYGAIPGGIAGALVGALWVKIMLKRIRRVTKPSGAFWGMLMGLIATIALHGTMGIALMIWQMVGAHPAHRTGHGDVMLDVWVIWTMAVTIGLPIGIFSGAILGAICGGILRAKVEALAWPIVPPPPGQTGEP